MDREQARGTAEKHKGARKDANRPQDGFDKPLGSSRNDQADLRDVADEAAKKSR